MSKYNKLWTYVSGCGKDTITLTFAEIEQIAGVALDHSFLQYKKELDLSGYRVVKISMKEQTVLFQKCNEI